MSKEMQLDQLLTFGCRASQCSYVIQLRHQQVIGDIEPDLELNNVTESENSSTQAATNDDGAMVNDGHMHRQRVVVLLL